MLEVTDFPGVDESLALSLIGVAISIAPCLDNLEPGRNRQIAIATIRRIAVDAKTRGSLLVRSQRIDTASVEYAATESWFTPDQRTSLRALCAVASASGLPVGSFPPAGVVGRMWPEGTYE